MTKMKAYTLAGVAAAALLAPAVSAQSETIYANVDNYLGFYTEHIGNGEIGDQIDFAGTARTVTEFRLEYFLTPGGAANAQVFIRANDGPALSPGVNAPGSVLYDSGVIALVEGQNNITATGLSLEVPNTVTWSIAFSGIDGTEKVGILYYDPPTIGASFDDFWQKTETGWQLFDNPDLKDNFGAIFTAVPEPSTWALLLGGMGMLGFFSFRRKS
jgi:hypothetical protein